MIALFPITPDKTMRIFQEHLSFNEIIFNQVKKYIFLLVYYKFFLKLFTRLNFMLQGKKNCGEENYKFSV